MTTLKIRCQAQYLTSMVNEMRGGDYNATHLVKAVKGLPLHPNAYTVVQIGGHKVRITEKNKDKAIEWFAEWAVPLVDALGHQEKTLVPIPSSSTVAKAPATFRTAKLADEIAKRCSTPTQAFPFLRWKRPKPPARCGGTRDARLLYPNLSLSRELPSSDCVLVDDVYTTGGHLVASAWFLGNLAGKTVLGAVCCGRTSWQQLQDPFEVDVERIEIGDPPDV